MSDVLFPENESVFLCSTPHEASEINLTEGSVVISTTPDIKTEKLEKTEIVFESADSGQENCQTEAPLDSSSEQHDVSEIAKEPVQECQDAKEHLAKQPKLQLETTSTTGEPSSNMDSLLVTVAPTGPSSEIFDSVLMNSEEETPAPPEINSSNAA